VSEPRYGVDDFQDVPGLLAHEVADSWHPFFLSAIEDAATVEPTLGNGLIYPGMRHVFSGPQESAKTLAAYAIGLDVIRTNPDRQILLLDFEMGPRGAKRRLRDLGATDDELHNQILYLAPEQPANLERMLILVALNPLLVIVDAAAGAFDNEGLDDNKRQDAERWRKLYVDPFFDNGIATIVLDHVTKDAESRGKYVIGSERKTGGGEVHIGFDTIKPVKRGGTGIYKMLLHKDREGHHSRGHFHDLHVTSDPGTHALTLEFRPVAHADDGTISYPTELMQRVSMYLLEQDEPVSRNQIVLNVKGNAEYVRRAIDHLVDLEYAGETTGPNRSRLYHHTRGFIRSEWENQADSQVRPSSSAVRPDEPGVGSSSSSPPGGGNGRTYDERTNPGSSTHNQTNQHDEETQRLLEQYHLTDTPPQNGTTELPGFDQ
jgi:hypothetical protein